MPKWEEGTLRRRLKAKLLERKELKLSIKSASEGLSQLRVKYYKVLDEVRVIEEALGSLKARGCPALQRVNKRYTLDEVVCKARRFRDRTFCREEMYRKHCYRCHLTREQARLAILYDHILLGRREDG